ncbi:uncharacterized protein LOC143857766 isoform X2 [Tasmannia lanceolata]|uniref:uncharacterized protein LOC143857766 isoform X2 n=1 Tax=Tasmannia lanceolata TaxID=3420 RepID=UPI004064B3D6
MSDLGKKWREWKSTLRTKYFLLNKPPLEGSVVEEQYRILCDYWRSPEGQERYATNKANRAQQTIVHSAGTQSYARVIEDELKIKGKMPSHVDLFLRTHTSMKKGRETADPRSCELIDILHQTQNPKPESSGMPSRVDLFAQLVGEERHCRVCMVGFGITPTLTLGITASPPQPRGNNVQLAR